VKKVHYTNKARKGNSRHGKQGKSRHEKENLGMESQDKAIEFMERK
jgi:hypothetical protein